MGLFLLDIRCCICESSILELSLCQNCQRTTFLSTPWDGSRFFSSFQWNWKAQKLLHQIKFQKKYPLLRLFDSFIPDSFPWVLNSNAQLIPIPLSPNRFFSRGFNQAEWLAHTLSKKTQIPLNSASLKKIKTTLNQSHLSKKERNVNLRNAFVWDSSRSVPEVIVLIDDVLTTGSTLRECETVLRAHGVKEVYGWTLFKNELINEKIVDENIQGQKADLSVRHRNDL